MADDDDDIIKLSHLAGEEIDLSEETQDFRFLSNLSFTGTELPKIPKRGEKDFEPHATKLQSSTLDASRAAMHAALSIPRVHPPKSHVYAVYDPPSNMVYVEKIKTQHFQTIGKHIGGKEWLFPEEALFMLERGSLDIRWPLPDLEVPKEGAGEEFGVPMSLQGAYAAFIGMERQVNGKLTLEMYTVYANLKRAGYIVLRSEEFSQPRGTLDESYLPMTKLSLLENLRAVLAFKHRGPDYPRFGPLVTPGLYRSYDDIYRLLQIIPSHNHHVPPSFSLPLDESNPYRVTFHVYKPSPAFRKSNPGPPHFRIAVINAREHPVPTLSQLNDLLATTPSDPPDPNSQLYQKLKHGKRNVILAVVDQGLISYQRFGDAAFCDEPVYKIKRGPGGKRGGFGKGRGRGRGRGR